MYDKKEQTIHEMTQSGLELKDLPCVFQISSHLFVYMLVFVNILLLW